jgi:protein-S-isoprenylcysteine O-methyltransferase Ste14
MNARFIAGLLVGAAVTLVPLLGAPQRLAHPGPWAAFVVACGILLTHPTIGPRDVAQSRTDRFSALGIYIAIVGSQLVSIIDYGYRPEWRPPPLSPQVLIGVALLLGGLAFRVWAIRTLGRFFTSTVVTQVGQTVVQDGPYRIVRHPSYTGIVVSVAGTALALGSRLGFLFLLVLVIPAYLWRIHVEESELRTTLGEPYAEFCRTRKRLIPFIY